MTTAQEKVEMFNVFYGSLMHNRRLQCKGILEGNMEDKHQASITLNDGTTFQGNWICL